MDQSIWMGQFMKKNYLNGQLKYTDFVIKGKKHAYRENLILNLLVVYWDVSRNIKICRNSTYLKFSVAASA